MCVEICRFATLCCETHCNGCVKVACCRGCMRNTIVLCSWISLIVLEWLHQGCESDLSADFRNFGASNFHFKSPFKNCFKIVFFSLWRRDPVLELQFLCVRASLCVKAFLCKSFCVRKRLPCVKALCVSVLCVNACCV